MAVRGFVKITSWVCENVRSTAMAVVGSRPQVVNEHEDGGPEPFLLLRDQQADIFPEAARTTPSSGATTVLDPIETQTSGFASKTFSFRHPHPDSLSDFGTPQAVGTSERGHRQHGL